MICDSCKKEYDDEAYDCPSCGAVNPKKYSGKGDPKTIKELQRWYAYHNLPPENITRFFIGRDYKEPRAFGIYFDGTNYIVYKNKDDGSRAIRYEGPDEAFAVHEILEKLKNEISIRKHPTGNSSTDNLMKALQPKKKKQNHLDNILSAIGGIFIVFYVVIAIIIGVSTIIEKHVTHRHDGYYNVNDTIYYNYGSDWYIWDDYYDDYRWTNAPFEGDYYDDYEYDYYGGLDYYDHDFYSSDKYESLKPDDSSSSDWSNDDYSWSSSDSWDSGTTDWGSDW